MSISPSFIYNIRFFILKSISFDNSSIEQTLLFSLSINLISKLQTSINFLM